MDKTIKRTTSLIVAVMMIVTLLFSGTTTGFMGKASASTVGASAALTIPANGCNINANGRLNVPDAVSGLKTNTGNTNYNNVINNSKLLQAISGTAVDTNGEGTNVKSVKVAVKNKTNGKYLDMSPGVMDFVGKATPIYNNGTISGSGANARSWTINTSAINFPSGNYVITVIVNDGKDGAPVTSVFNVLNAEIVSPRFDTLIKGSYQIEVAIMKSEADTGFVPQTVVATVAGTDFNGPISKPVSYSVPLTLDSSNTDVKAAHYVGTLDSTKIVDGTFTLVVTVTAPHYIGKAFQDFVIQNNPDHGFVKVKGLEFELDGKPFRYVGWNTNTNPPAKNFNNNDDQSILYIGDEANIVLIPKGSAWTSENWVDRQFVEGKKRGYTVMRTFNFYQNTSGDGTPGTMLNANSAKQLDYLLVSAKKNGVMLMPTLTYYWSSPQAAINQAYRVTGRSTAGLTVNKDTGVPTPNSAPYLEFFTDPKAIELYKLYIKEFAERTNPLNGIQYRDDPAIFAWDIANEPRMGYTEDNGIHRGARTENVNDPGYDPLHLWQSDYGGAEGGGAKLYHWIKEMSDQFYESDKKHMISVGTEGQTYTAPGTNITFAGLTQQGFGGDPLGTSNALHIDFLTIHPYLSDPWSSQGFEAHPASGGMSTEEAKIWLKAITARAVELGKPLVMAEYGVAKIPSNDRRQDPGLTDNLGNVIPLENTEAYLRAYNQWNEVYVQGFINNVGAAGLNVWQIVTSQDDYNYALQVYYNNIKVNDLNTLMIRKPVFDTMTKAVTQIYSSWENPAEGQ